MKKVLVSLSSDSIAARECFIGVYNYINAGHDWQIEIVPSPYDITPDTIQNAKTKGIDGILTGINMDTAGFRAAVNSGLPLSLINVPPNWRPAKRKDIVILHNDDERIGRMGADHLRGIGAFRTYAYIPGSEKSFWSTYRRRGFQSRLLEFGIIPKIHSGKTSLSDWISSLPKPAAILAAYDRLAVHAIEVCRELKLKVPSQVAVLGVDNDSLYCDNARPTISSIHPNHIELGRRAAEQLDRIMHRRRPSPATLIPPIGIVVRESTRTVPPVAHLIQNALNFIQFHHQDGIGVKDVARHLHVSESLLRLRFRETHGKSLRDVLTDMRIASAKKLLSRTKTPISSVATQCGFSSTAHLSHFFKERLGCAPSHYRKRPPKG